MTLSSDLMPPPTDAGAGAPRSPGAWLVELDPADVVRPGANRGFALDEHRARTIREAVTRAAAEATQRGWRAGHETGYEAGHREGVRAARTETAAAVAALEASAQDLQRRAATDLADAAQTIALAALELAEAVIGGHIRASADPGADALARALAVAPSGRLVARMHPDDVALLQTAALPPDGRVTVAPDPTIERGGCVLEGGATTIDAQIRPAIARARQALLEPPGSGNP